MDLGENPHTNIWKINIWEARVCIRTSPRLHFAEKNNANQTISNTQINGNPNRVPFYTPGWLWPCSILYGFSNFSAQWYQCGMIYIKL